VTDVPASVLVMRALRLRCPLCGKGRMFRRWIHLRDYCDTCGFRFDRNEPDYFIGAYTINLIVAELFVVGLMVAVILVTWPDVPWDNLTWRTAIFMVFAPVLTYPFSKTLWLAIDLMFQPPKPAEYRGAGDAD
jgi:uncharacterized protein (DUF983 family)